MFALGFGHETSIFECRSLTVGPVVPVSGLVANVGTAVSVAKSSVLAASCVAFVVELVLPPTALVNARTSSVTPGLRLHEITKSLVAEEDACNVSSALSPIGDPSICLNVPPP